jgi:poly(beta-D-mannuronate) lyase
MILPMCPIHRRLTAMSGKLSLCLAALAFCASAAGAPLRSPWDLKPVTVRDAGSSCPPIVSLPKDIEASSFYDDPQHSRIDPKLKAKYDAAQAQFRGVTADAITAAEKFRSTGNQGAAECVLRILDAQADDHSMTGSMSSNQAYYVQNWTLGALAVTWLKVRQADPGKPEDRAKAVAWMTTVANQAMAYFTARHQKGTNDGTNNHYYWAGYAVMAVGIAADDRKLFDWGVGTYNEAMSRIEPDGTLPLEMDRGQRALHYHVFALAPLTSMAEMGFANGLDLYNADNHALQRLVNVTASGLVNNSLFTAKAKAVQDTPEKSGLKSEDVIWLTPWLAHYPDANLIRLLHSVPLKPFGYLGGYPPG